MVVDDKLVERVNDYEVPFRFEIVKDLLSSYGLKSSNENAAELLFFVEDSFIKDKVSKGNKGDE